MQKERREALDILMAYNVLTPDATNKKDFELAREEGFMFRPTKQNHGEAMRIINETLPSIKKKDIIELFLSSFSSGCLEDRATFPVFAIMQSFPSHKFEPYSNENLEVCKICGSYKEDMIDRSFLNQTRYKTGGIVAHNIYAYAFYLQQFTLMNSKKPLDRDIEIFTGILNFFAEASQNDTPTIVQKKIKTVKAFKSTDEQRKLLIDTLGFSGILQTEQHKGFLDNYVPIELMPRKSRSSDWRYPVDWWTGKDGINKKAAKFWFGSYIAVDKIA